MPPSPSRVADLLKGRGVLAVEAEIKRRIRDGTATTGEQPIRGVWFCPSVG